MLVLSRKMNERILINGDIRVTILSLRGNQVRIGIEAPEHVKVLREELTAYPIPTKVNSGYMSPGSALDIVSDSDQGEAVAPLASAMGRFHLLNSSF